MSVCVCMCGISRVMLEVHVRVRVLKGETCVRGREWYVLQLKASQRGERQEQQGK